MGEEEFIQIARQKIIHFAPKKYCSTAKKQFRLSQCKTLDLADLKTNVLCLSDRPSTQG